MTQHNKIRELANQITDFMINHDPYEFKDLDQSPDELKEETYSLITDKEGIKTVLERLGEAEAEMDDSDERKELQHLISDLRIENQKYVLDEKLSKTQSRFIEDVIDSLDQNTLPWRAGWDTTVGVQMNPVSKTTYKGFNQLGLLVHAMINNYTDPRWCTLKQGNKEYGAIVKTGSKGYPVQYFEVKNKRTKGKWDWNYYYSLTPEEREKEIKNKRIVLKTYTVFNAQQFTNFPELEKDQVIKPEFNDETSRIYSENILKNMQLAEFKEGGKVAAYNVQTDTLFMPEKDSFESQEDYYATLWHECGHATGHPGRLDRDLSGSFGSSLYAIEELRVEMSSFFQQLELGIDVSKTGDNAIAYCQSWGRLIKDNPTVFLDAVNDSLGIKKYMNRLGRLNTILNKIEIEFVKEDEVLKLLCTDKKTGRVREFETGYPQSTEVYQDPSSSKVLFQLEELMSEPAFNQLISDLEKNNSFKHELKTRELLLDLDDAVEQRLLKEVVLNQSSDIEQKDYQKRNQDKSQTKQEVEKDVTQISLDELKQKVSIQAYAERNLGFTITHTSNSHDSLSEHDSVRIYRDNTFARYSQQGVGGSVIDFVKHFEQCDTKEAIQKIKLFYFDHEKDLGDIQPRNVEPSKVVFKLPEPGKSNQAVINYLENERHIDHQVVQEYIDRKLVYESLSKEMVFVGDINGLEKFATRRKISGVKSYADVPGSIKDIGVYVNNNSKQLVITESVIDAMSYQTLNDKNRTNDYLSVNGVASATTTTRTHLSLRQKIKDGNQLKYDKIILAFDNDDPGQNAALLLKDHLQNNYENLEVEIDVPKTNDFNQDLVENFKEVELDQLKKLEEMTKMQQKQMSQTETKNLRR